MITQTIFDLALNLYHEARGESLAGQKAVCKVVLNRAQRRRKTVNQVIYAASQFSWTEDNLPDYPKETFAFKKCIEVAQKAVDEFINGDNLLGADHYHAEYVNPSWANSLTKITQIDNHIFYRS